MTVEAFEKCKESGRRSLFYLGKADWWKWRGGSHPFFWQWPEEFQLDIRDGLAPMAWLQDSRETHQVAKKGNE
jgi:hypothetical protein